MTALSTGLSSLNRTATSPRRKLLVLATFGLLVGACSKAKPTESAKELSPAAAGAASVLPSPTEARTIAASATAPAAAPLASAIPSTPSLSEDATGTLALSWKLANAPNEYVSVSLVAGDQTFELGKLSAASDDAHGTVETCAMKNKGTTESRLSCGMTPFYNWYTAKLSGGSLVVTLTTGVYDDVGSEKVKEVLSKPTTATALKVTGPAPKGISGNCTPGFVQKGPDKPCMKQCLKGKGCKATEKCELTAVEGTDGPHKVSACVPK